MLDWLKRTRTLWGAAVILAAAAGAGWSAHSATAALPARVGRLEEHVERIDRRDSVALAELREARAQDHELVVYTFRLVSCHVQGVLTETCKRILRSEP